MKVLIVDDSKVMRLIVARALRQSGLGNLEILEAEDGGAALEVVRTEEPSLVLSDWNMPHMSGLELLQRVREMGNTQPFGFITSESHPKIAEQATEAGATFLLTKPFEVEALAAQIMVAAR
jgi:two-component system chemotaxis response regulator CheY